MLVARCAAARDGTWIERTYHRRRRQERLGRLTPIDFATDEIDRVLRRKKLRARRAERKADKDKSKQRPPTMVPASAV